MSIEENIQKYLEDRSPNKRYASFDYCYNYFNSFYEKGKISEIAEPENIYFSCLQIGFFLASWGMLRGSSFLLDKSIKHYEDLIYLISKSSGNPIWNIDAADYTEDNKLDILLDYGDKIANVLSTGEDENVTDTLKTKIMLGIFGNVPALDTYNKKAYNISSFTKNNLKKIRDYYENNKEIIKSINIYTIDYYTRESTNRLYTEAKIIDMIGFIKGKNMSY